MENRFVWILFCTIWLIRLPAFSQQGSSGERMFFYHHDHLGNTVFVTDEVGEVVQHVEYLPTGEVFVEEKNPASTYATPYKFNGKELEELSVLNVNGEDITYDGKALTPDEAEKAAEGRGHPPGD